MKLITSPRLLLCAVILAVSPTVAHAQYFNGQDESHVWGQPNFTTNTAATVSAGALKTPFAVATDPATGRFFVADTANNRVLRYSSQSAAINGAAADCVFGQISYATSSNANVNPPPTIDADTMNAPSGVVVDSTGHLWVADTGNNRVLRFDNAATLAPPSAAPTNTEGLVANGVLGQLNFVTNIAGTSQRNMSAPVALAVDSQGSLYVADSVNNRVLQFTNPAGKINGANADGLIGQTNYNSGAVGTTASTLNNPVDVMVDSDSNLWVADANNNRVLMFPSISSLSPLTLGPAASIVIGQLDFITGTATAASASTLNKPDGLCEDVQGRLIVSDSGYNRVLVFSSPTAVTAGLAANFVLGQTDFLASGAAITQTGLSAPAGATFISDQIFVADAANNRVVSFALTAGTPTVTVVGGVKLPTNKNKSFNFYVGNSSSAGDSFKIGVTIPGSTKNLAKLSFTYAGADITGAITSNTFTTALGAGTQYPITVKVTPKTKAKKQGGSISFTVNMVSTTTTSNTATGTVKAKFNKPKKK